MKISALASEPHFVDHLAPVWDLIPPELRGKFYTGERGGTGSLARTRKLGVQSVQSGLPVGRGIVLCAASGDLAKTTNTAPHARVAFFEHGCGLSYNTRQSSYAGAISRPNVDLFIFPNEFSAAKQREVHDRRIESIGSSPRLDRWVGVERSAGEKPVVAISFHWDCHVVPETRSALYFYRRHLHELCQRGWTVLGHAHPRMIGHAGVAYRQAGITLVEDFNEIMERADLYAVDNSSTLYEFAALDRPVVAMNCPRYRRGVSHGLRFWDNVPGLQCDQPEDLADVIAAALEDPPEAQKLRRDAVDVVFPLNDGRAAERAAGLVLELWGQLEANYPDSEVPTGRARVEYIVTNPAGESIERFLVADEARRMARKRGDGWDVAEVRVAI